MFGRAKVCALGVMVMAIGLLAAGPAHALRTYVDYDSLVISGQPGETNDVVVVPDPGPADGPSFLISDRAPLNAGRGCEKVARTTVRCALAPDYPRVYLSLGLGDGNDNLHLEGAFWSEYVDGGPGNDRLDLTSASNPAPYLGDGAYFYGGSGDDTLWTANGSEDHVDCGTGNDTAARDELDDQTACEKRSVCYPLPNVPGPRCVQPGLVPRL